jgi:hypothetical protein
MARTRAPAGPEVMTAGGGALEGMMIVEELWERIHNLLVDVPRYQQVDAIQRLCLEFAAPLAEAVVRRAEMNAHETECRKPADTYAELENRSAEGCRLFVAQSDAYRAALPIARAILAARKER